MDIPSLTRRDALKASLLGAAALALPWQGVLSAKSASRIAESKLPRPYTVPFYTPPVLRPAMSDATGDYYRITQTAFVGEVLPGIKTPLWGYNGLVPGPTIKARRGRQTVMRQINALPEKHPTLGYVPWTSTHLHGMPSKPQYDGYAGDNSMPGMWKDYVYPNSCEARTLWYHDHGVHHTAENVYMGLAAQYHLSDEVEDALPIPKGRYDLPLTISDAAFAENGALLWDDNSHSGIYGDVVLVNGRPWPTLAVEQRKYRFRVLNASVARGYLLRLSNGQPFQVIATDGGFMAIPQTVTELKIGMAERYEIVVDFAAITPGQKIQLVNRGVKNSTDYDHTGKVMQFEVSGPASDTRNNDVPAVLTTPHPAMTLTPAMSQASRYMRLERTNNLWTINGTTWDDVAKDEYVPVFANPQVGDVEIWEVENKSGGWFHPLHVHLVDFQVLSRNGRPAPAHERGPKDVVYIGEGETVKLIMRFGPEHGRYMIHCHNLSHEDHDMMTQFQVGDHDADCDPVNAAPPTRGAETPWDPRAFQPEAPGTSTDPTSPAPPPETPSPAPAPSAPTTTAPSTAPRTTAPRTTAPKATTTPKTSTPKTSTPKTTTPKTTTPKTTTPKTTTPKTTAPKTTAPKTTAPRTTTSSRTTSGRDK
jgi:spore coat protein A